MNEVLEVTRAWNISPSTKIIKWYQTKLTYEEKYRFGHLTYPEYIEWQNELYLQYCEENNLNPDGTPASESELGDKAYNATSSTFWKDDTSARNNVSSDEYNDFLSENNIDVSNNNTVDVSSILADMEDSAPPADEDVDVNDVLKQVNKDIKGDTILSEDEIAALFAAAAGGEVV